MTEDRRAGKERRTLLKRDGGRRSDDSPPRAQVPCPFCGHLTSRVLNCQRFTHREGIFRRRECQNCDKRFTTEEIVKKVYPSGAIHLPPHI